MKLITCQAIRQHNPCDDPATKLPEDYSASVLDFLVKETQVPPPDRIWVAVRFLSDKTNRLFAVDCARRALGRLENPDPRSLTACYVAERYAHGQATEDELRAAEWAAWSAARSAAGAAAWVVAAARSAARSAAESAWEAAWSTAEWAVWSSRSAAWTEVPGNEERELQVSRLIELIKEWEA